MSEQKIGIVVIGKNEGLRLIKCLESASTLNLPLIYVDSGSTDSSVENASNYTKDIIKLSMEGHFSASRARNEGLSYLVRKLPSIEFVQFVDGDCVLSRDWIDISIEKMNLSSSYAVVCGRRKELFPEKSLYNKLCDIEWDVTAGEVLACGGDFLCRVTAFEQVKGFNVSFIAGEEPELCFRLRQHAWKILRTTDLMTFHDSNILCLSKYLVKIRRTGYAYCLGFLEHGMSAEHYNMREVLRIIFWGFLLPIAFLFYVLIGSWNSNLVIVIFLAQFMRVYQKVKNYAFLTRFVYAAITVFGKTVECMGLFQCLLRKITRSQNSLIEYK